MKIVTCVVLAGLLALTLTGLPAPAEPAKPNAPDNEKTLANSIGLKLALIPPGKFLMGSPPAEVDRDSDELEHELTITKPFYMGIYEVTQEQFQKVTGRNTAFFKSGPEYPVEQVLLRETQEFCTKLSNLPEEKKAGRVYRLPTEAEWEYACRAGSTTPFSCGKTLSSTQANFNGSYPYGEAAKGPSLGKTSKVGSYPPNAFGLYDMHGNVWEWCADFYEEKYYQKSPKTDPLGPPKGVFPTGYNDDFFVVVRGGCWLDEGAGCRSAYRFRFMPHERYRLIGFRVVCGVPTKAP